MNVTIRRIEYYYATTKDMPGEGYRLLARLAEAGVSLQAFNSVPMGPAHTRFVLFPDDVDVLKRFAEETGVELLGPQFAFLVQGEDAPGILVELHRRVSQADINVFASVGVTDGKGGFGYIMYVRPERYEEAAQILGV